MTHESLNQQEGMAECQKIVAALAESPNGGIQMAAIVVCDTDGGSTQVGFWPTLSFIETDLPAPPEALEMKREIFLSKLAALSIGLENLVSIAAQGLGTTAPELMALVEERKATRLADMADPMHPGGQYTQTGRLDQLLGKNKKPD